MICLSVCHNVSPTKTAEPIEIPFGTWTPVDPMNHVIDGVARSSTRKSSVEGDDAGISPHAVDWPAAEAVKCQIKHTQ